MTPADGELRQDAAGAGTARVLTPQDFDAPGITLGGTVDYAMHERFRQQLAQATDDGLIVTGLPTRGGDPEVAGVMGEDVRFHSDIGPCRRFVFLGRRPSIRPARRS